MVWELKENWRLYEANRPLQLGRAVVGSHGETMLRLLKPGFHSGTLPKLFAKLRRLQRRPVSFSRYRGRTGLLEQLHYHTVDIRRHFDRELLALLQGCPTWNNLELEVSHITANSSSIRVEITCRQIAAKPLAIAIQMQSGWLVAGLVRAGWVDQLEREERDMFVVALAGFYRLCGVDLVREQLESCFQDAAPPYDITSAGLVVWPDLDYEVEATYDLHRKPRIHPTPWTVANRYSLPVVARRDLVFRETSVLWSEWVAWWDDPPSGRGTVRHLQPAALILLPQHRRTNDPGEPALAT